MTSFLIPAERAKFELIGLCLFRFESRFSCGESEIRTREPVLPVTRFPGVPLQPLEHLSFVKRLQNYTFYFRNHTFRPIF